MYYLVVVWGWRDRVKRFISNWRGHIKYGLPKEVREEIVLEKRVDGGEYIVLVKQSLLGLWLCRKLREVAKKYGAEISIYEPSYADVESEKYIDQKIREKIEEIPPHLVYEVRKALLERKLPRGRKRKQVIQAMKM